MKPVKSHGAEELHVLWCEKHRIESLSDIIPHTQLYEALLYYCLIFGIKARPDPRPVAVQGSNNGPTIQLLASVIPPWDHLQ